MYFEKELLNLNQEDIAPIVEKLKSDFHSVEYYDVITYYYDVVMRRSVKRGYEINKGYKLLNKLEQWEETYEEKECYLYGGIA